MCPSKQNQNQGIIGILDSKMGEQSEEGRAVDVPAPIALLLIPFLAIAGVLSFPVIGVLFVYFSLSERRFVKQMKSLNRMMDWPRFLHSVEKKQGTVIEEWLSEKGPVRRWWTADDVTNISPYGLPEHGVEAVFDRQFDPFCSWCYENYTNDRTGKALLLASSYVSKLWDRTENLIPAMTIVAMAATAHQRSSWAKSPAHGPAT